MRTVLHNGDKKKMFDEPIQAPPDRIYQSQMVPPDYTALSLPKYSKNRSRRMHKKLMKRVRGGAYPAYNKVWMIMGNLYCHPTVYYQIKRAGE